jgi:hypothetical protein
LMAAMSAMSASKCFMTASVRTVYQPQRGTKSTKAYIRPLCFLCFFAAN